MERFAHFEINSDKGEHRKGEHLDQRTCTGNEHHIWKEAKWSWTGHTADGVTMANDHRRRQSGSQTEQCAPSVRSPWTWSGEIGSWAGSFMDNWIATAMVTIWAGVHRAVGWLITPIMPHGGISPFTCRKCESIFIVFVAHDIVLFDKCTDSFYDP